MNRVETMACSLNCWDTCGFKVTIENATVKKVDGDADHSITQGEIFPSESEENAPELHRKYPNRLLTKIKPFPALSVSQTRSCA